MDPRDADTLRKQVDDLVRSLTMATRLPLPDSPAWKDWHASALPLLADLHARGSVRRPYDCQGRDCREIVEGDDALCETCQSKADEAAK